MSGEIGGAFRSHHPVLVRYAVAVLAVLAAVAVREALAPLLASHAPLLLFALSVMLASRFGGVGPGVAASALSAAIGAYFFIEPYQSLAIGSLSDLAYIALFLVVGLGISLLNGELHRTLERSRADQLRFEKIAATAPGVICSFRLRPDGSACFPYASPSIRNIYGLEPHELRDDASPIFAMMPAEDAAHVRESIAESARTMAPWRDQFRVRKPSSPEIWVEGHSQPSRLADGSIEWYGFIADISERHRMEQALRDHSEQLEALTRSLELAQAAGGIGTWDWDVAGNVTHWSDACGPLYGLPKSSGGPTPEEWLGLIHPDDRQRVRSDLQHALDGTAPFDTEFRVIGADGAVRWLLGKGQVFRDAAGKPVRMLGVNADITDRKTAAEELRALSASLISVQEEERRRISQELHDDLTQRLCFMAIDLGRLMSQFPDLPPAAREELRFLQERAVQASELTRHMAHELHPSILDDLGIETALRSYCVEFSKREEVAVDVRSSGLPRTMKRETASCLYAVAQEGLVNAAKHARAHQVTVEISGGPRSIRLSVTDDGIGFRCEPGAAGMGLGIVNMRERVRWVKGSFSIESQPFQGTRIAVEIPI